VALIRIFLVFYQVDMALFTIVSTDIILDAARVPGHGAFLHVFNKTDTNGTGVSADDEIRDTSA
jgi:hypothetical protein